jgi:hypothetical protein
LAKKVNDENPLVRGKDPRIRIQTRIHTKISLIRNTAYSEATSSNLRAKAEEEEEEEEEEEFLTPASSPEICPETIFTFPPAAAASAAERKVSRLEAASVPGVGGGRETRNSRVFKVHFVCETLNLRTSVPYKYNTNNLFPSLPYDTIRCL